MKTTYLVLALLLAEGAGLAQSTRSKLAAELLHVDSGSTVRVIVQFKQRPTAANHQSVLSRGGLFRRQLNSVKGGAYTIPAAALPFLEKDPNISHISIDHQLMAKLDYTTAAANATTAWNSGLDGTGVGVAIIDSGISPMPDLTDRNGNSRIVYTQDFVGTDGLDYYGHGTHIAGIIGSNGQSSTCATCTHTIKGFAPNVNLIDLRVLDQNGEASDSDVVAAIDAAIQLQQTYNIRVINLSIGRPVFESYQQDPLCQAAEAAWKAGITVVVAAGNDGRDNSMGTNGYGTVTAPGNDPMY